MLIKVYNISNGKKRNTKKNFFFLFVIIINNKNNKKRNTSCNVVLKQKKYLRHEVIKMEHKKKIAKNKLLKGIDTIRYLQKDNSY